MPFVKLDTGILRSTLWMERDQCDVFLTALLMAEPKEFKEPQSQIEVDSLELTGFVAPSGWYGFCAAAGVGIIRMSHTDPEPGMAALRALGNPDDESRSKGFGGRRMIRVDGGYLILNYMAYREKDYEAKDRMRLLRQRRKLESQDVTPNRRNVTPNSDSVHPNNRNGIPKSDAVPPNVTHADADADADTGIPPTPLASELHMTRLVGTTGNSEWRGLACGVLDGAGIAYGVALLRKVEAALIILAREEECEAATAADRLLERMQAAAEEGPQKWLLWIEDGRWKKAAEFHLEGPA